MSDTSNNINNTITMDVIMTRSESQVTPTPIHTQATLEEIHYRDVQIGHQYFHFNNTIVHKWSGPNVITILGIFQNYPNYLALNTNSSSPHLRDLGFGNEESPHKLYKIPEDGSFSPIKLLQMEEEQEDRNRLDQIDFVRLDTVTPQRERNQQLERNQQRFLDHWREPRLAAPPNDDVGEAARVAEFERQQNELFEQVLAAEAEEADAIPGLIPQELFEQTIFIHLRQFEAFTLDNQNVHRTLTVNFVKDMINRILAIPVSDAYKWNKDDISNTPAEIITKCGLDITVVQWTIEKYISSANIYEMGDGIYGRTLDGIWQYIKTSEHTEDLCKILAEELKDNVGQCLQGNLSRLCNVLAGYMDGVGSQESVSEILGRKFSQLMTVENQEDRISQGNTILDYYDFTDPVKRAEWLEALL